MVCPACGAEVPEGTQWCGKCFINILNPEIGHLASVGRRLGAIILDKAITYFVLVFLLGFLYVPIYAILFLNTSKTHTINLYLLMFAMFASYIGFYSFFYSKGTTPGKAILRIYIVKKDGRIADFGTMIVREWIVKLISTPFFLGFLWALFDKEKRTWHDMILGTYVVVRPKRQAAMSQESHKKAS